MQPIVQPDQTIVPDNRRNESNEIDDRDITNAMDVPKPWVLL